MKEILTIATFNYQNHYHPYQTLKDKTECYSFIKFIMENDIDILGTQETTIRNLKLCEPLLTDYGYKIFGDGRYGKIGYIYPVNLANETNSIIFKKELGKGQKTIKLPWLGTTFPRIITKAEFGNLTFLNTHLDNINTKVKEKQLKYIFKLIQNLRKENKQIILTGDFNMTLKNKQFKKFIDDLKKLNIKRVEADKPSCRGIKFGPIDHIFIPQEFEVKEIKQPNISISDHKPIIVKVKRN